MRRLLVSVLVAVIASTASGVASAQPGLSTGPNLDGIDRARRIEDDTRRALEVPRKAGLDALQAGDFATAEKNFADLASRIPTTSDAHYLMGLAELGLKKWDAAKGYLEIAVKEEPKRPEPKARLGVAYVMTGETAAAVQQRAELANLAAKCKNGCADASRIADNIAMLDKVLAAVKKPATPG